MNETRHFTWKLLRLLKNLDKNSGHSESNSTIASRPTTLQENFNVRILSVSSLHYYK